MNIYKVRQITWNNRKMSDFDLPDTLGHFKTYGGALNAMERRMNMINSSEANKANDCFVTFDDFSLTELELKD